MPWVLSSGQSARNTAVGTILEVVNESANPAKPIKRLVFVSHCGLDTWVAKQIAREIEAHGGTPFLDEAQVDAGADFEEDILDFLQRAHELVVLLTPWALERPKPALFFELGAAIGMGKRVVSIVPKDMDPGNLPLDVRLRRYLVRDSPEQTAEELSNALMAA